MSRYPQLLFLTCTTRPSRASCWPLLANFPFLVLIGSPIFQPLVLLCLPRRVLIYCSARNTAHVGDMYPASSNSSVRLFSFRIVVISTCSWPSQRCCFPRKFHPLLVIVHPRPGSRHVVRPSIVMSLVPLALPIP